MIPIKIVIDHNNDTVEIMRDDVKLDTQMVIFTKVKDTSMLEKILSEIFNLMAINGDLMLELETINEEHRSTEGW